MADNNNNNNKDEVKESVAEALKAGGVAIPARVKAEGSTDGDTPNNTPAPAVVAPVFNFGGGQPATAPAGFSFNSSGASSGSAPTPAFNFGAAKKTTKKEEEEDDEEDDGEEADMSLNIAKKGGKKGGRGGDMEGMFSNPAMLAAIQAKLSGMTGPSGYIATLPTEVRTRVRGLKKLQKEFIDLQEAHDKAVKEMEIAFLEKTKGLREKRAAIVSGKYEPTPDELGSDIESEAPEPTGEAPEVGVPKFWFNAIIAHPAIADYVSENDEELLEHITDIDWAPLKGDDHGYEITFTFAPNSYITNTTLTKKYFFRKHVIDGMSFDHAEGCKIGWKKGKNLTVRTVPGKKGRGGKVVTKTESVPSFFDFFDPPAVPSPEEIENLTEDQAEELETMMEVDYELGEEIKNRIIPLALLWYTGDAVSMSEKFGNDEFDFGDGEGGDEGDDDEDDDGDDGEGGDDKTKAPAPPPECNQQ